MYAEAFPKLFLKSKGAKATKAIGPAFFDEVHLVIQALGPHFKGVVTKRLGSVPASLSGDPSAFERYVHVMQSKLPWSGMSLEM